MENNTNTSVEINNALKRLKWTIEKKGNQEDAEAFNSLLAYITKMQTQFATQSPVITKFFLWIFTAKAMFYDQNKNPINAKQIIADINKIVTTPYEDLLKNFMEQVPLIRLEMLYKDYEKQLREASLALEKNKIPAMQSETLEDAYQPEDLQRYAEAKRQQIQAIENDLKRAILTPYTKEEAEHFIRNEVTHIILTQKTN